MKKLTIALTVCLLLTITSCTKVGPTGPQGPSGAVATELDFIVQPSDWGTYGTSGTPGAYTYALLTDTNLAYAHVGTGIVLAYMQYEATWAALPFTVYNASGTGFTKQYTWRDGSINIEELNTAHTFSTFASAITFRIVIIPGTGKTSWPVDLTDYAAVKKFFKLK
jgi:hypothetical protein